MNEEINAMVPVEAANGSSDELELEREGMDLGAGLSPMQARAFEVLTCGGTITGAAMAAGVTRRTMYGWLAEGQALAAAYRQWKSSMAETSRTRLLMIAEAATVTIARSVKNGDTQAALAVVKGMGILSPPATGPSMMEAVARKKEAEAARGELETSEKKARSQTFAELVNVEGFAEEMRQSEEREGRGGGSGSRGV
jgi:hypothetical protein